MSTADIRPAPVRWRADLVVGLAYLLGGLWVSLHLWTSPRHSVLSSFPPDQYQFEFWLTHAARIFTHGEHPFFTGQMNVPDGVNMMANTSTFGMTMPLVPVTLLFGPAVAFAVMVILAPFLTALCWYLLFSRRVVRSRWAAAVAGGLCGFGPGIIAQDNVHPNVAMQAAVPLIGWQLLRLRDRDVPAGRPGLVLGALVVYQFFVNEEILLFAAFGWLVFGLAWAGFNRAEARDLIGRFLVGLAVGAGLAATLLAYPMWYQFFGPQHYHGFGEFPTLFGADVASFTAFPTQSIADGQDSLRIANNVVEETTFFGWPLLVMSLVWTVLLWRHAAVRAAAIGAVLFAVASLGGRLHVSGTVRKIPAPWGLVSHAPLLDSVIASRLTLAILPMLALPLALALSRILAGDGTPPRAGVRVIALAGVAVALVPLIPTPFSATARDPLPRFVTSGQWRGYVGPGHSMLLIPVPTGSIGVAALEWTDSTNGQLPLAGGYFVGPDPEKPDGAGMFGPPHRPTLNLLYGIAATGRVPVLTGDDRRHAIEDIRYGRASVVVLSPYQPAADQLRAVMTDLIGRQPRYTGDVWLWDVRSLTG